MSVPSSAALAVLPAAVSAGWNALAENPGRNRSTEPRPQLALDCEAVASGGEVLGLPVDSESPQSVARRSLSRHGLRRGDRLSTTGPGSRRLPQRRRFATVSLADRRLYES